MMKFLWKGLIRDRSRSLFPVLTVVLGVMLCVLYYCWIKGMEDNIIQTSARLSTGHLKIMSRAYAREPDQMPNDLALMGIEALLEKVRQTLPSLAWTPRILFGGLLDIPDENGETKTQGPVAGLAVDLFSPSSPEPAILQLRESLVRGHLPQRPGEILVSDEFAVNLQVQPGDTATLISSTMYGSMATANYVVAGTIRFGNLAMDRGTMVADITDIQEALDMKDAAGEILGYFRDGFYDDRKAREAAAAFNASYGQTSDEFSPVADTLKNLSGMADMLDMVGNIMALFTAIFVLAMAIVLWNAGLMGQMRRYGEIGVRLAMGENKGHVYRSMLAEALSIGFVGTVVGTVVGLGISFYLQSKGINLSSLWKNASIMMTNTVRARITPVSYFIGFVPGLLATFFGAAVSGIRIFKRQTAQLIRELET